MRFVKGWARKAAIPILCISALGWIVYVVACSFLQFGGLESILGTEFSTPFWLFVASGPPLYVLGIIYLLTGNSIVGLATNFFTIVSLVSSGVAMWYTVSLIQLAFSGFASDLQVYHSRATMFSGCLVSVLFLAIFVLLSPFYIINTPKCCMNLSEEDRVAFGRQLPQSSQLPQPAGYMMQPMYVVPQTSNQPQAIPVVQAAVAPISYQPAMDIGAETKP